MEILIEYFDSIAELNSFSDALGNEVLPEKNFLLFADLACPISGECF